MCGSDAALCQITLTTGYFWGPLALDRIAVLCRWMRPIVTDQVARSVCQSVMTMNPAKMAEPIEMPFGLWTPVGLRDVDHLLCYK